MDVNIPGEANLVFLLMLALIFAAIVALCVILWRIVKVLSRIADGRENEGRAKKSQQSVGDVLHT